MNRQQFLTRLDKEWQALKDSFSGLSETQLLIPGVSGNWSVKDILAHVTTWEEEALKYAPTILKGERPPRYSVMYGGIDAFNARVTEQKRDLEIVEVLRQMTDTHQRLVEFIEGIPEEQFKSETSFRRRVRLDTYSHYPKHAKAIKAWRDQSRSRRHV